MKTTELPMVQQETISRMSKPRRQGEAVGASKRPALPAQSRLGSMSNRMSPIPIEWLDPDCWRLPSGKALAEFALQAGFLAPLMLGLPRAKSVPGTKARGKAEGLPEATELGPGGEGRGGEENEKLSGDASSRSAGTGKRG